MALLIPIDSKLETPRFYLTIPQASDIPHVFSATRYEGFNDGMPWEPPASIEELAAPLQRSKEAWLRGSGYAFSIYQKGTGSFLGRISIRKTDQDKIWNVGFWTHPEHQKKGVMTEALGAILSFGFETLGALEIDAAYATWNKASEKVLTNNGMQFVEFIEQGFQKKGVWVAENLMSIKRQEWAEK